MERRILEYSVILMLALGGCFVMKLIASVFH